MQVGVANQIDCTVEKGYPEPSITWTRKEDNEKVLSNGRSLMLPNATADIQGVYCVEVCMLLDGLDEEVLTFNLSGAKLGGVRHTGNLGKNPRCGEE